MLKLTSFLLLLLTLLSPIACINISYTPDIAIPLGAPTFIPNTIYGTTVTFTAAQLKVPLPSQPPDAPFSLLHEGFLCPYSDACDPSALPPCLCDFSLAASSPSACAALPPCCQAAYPSVLPALCADPSRWTPLSPASQPLDFLAKDLRYAALEPRYFLYQPSPAARCRGVGFHVIPSPASTASLSFSVVLYASLTHAVPHEDPAAWAISFLPTSNAEMAQNTRFCPASSLSANLSLAAPSPSNYFFFPQTSSNHRTIFFSLHSVSIAADGSVLPSLLRLRVVETNDVRDGTFVQSPSALSSCDPDFPALPCLPQRGTVAQPLALGAHAYFLYTHPASSPVCQALTFDVRVVGSGDAHLYVSFPEESQEPNFYAASYMSRKSGGDSVLFFMCPGERVAVGPHMYFGQGTVLLTVSADAGVVVLDTAREVNRFYLASTMMNAARMECQEVTTLGWFHVPSTDSYDYRCTSWWGQWFDNCRQFYPLIPIDNPTPLWPPGPPPYSNYLSSISLELDLLADYSLALNYSNYWAAVVLQRILTSATGTQTATLYFNVDQLTTCHVEFLSKLYDPAQQRILRGKTVRFASPAEPCELSAYQDVNAQIRSAVALLASPDVDPLTQDLKVSLTSLQPEYAVCNSLFHEVTYPETVTIGTQTVFPGNCSALDPCCPSAPAEVRLLYDVCRSTTAITSQTLQPNASFVASGCTDGECVGRLLVEGCAVSDYLVGEPIEKCSFNAKTAADLSSLLDDYLLSCRSRFLGANDGGLECQALQDCPMWESGRVVCSPSHGQSSYAQFSGYQTKRCLADTQFWDQLVFQCFVEELPDFIDTYFRAVLSLPPKVPLTDPSVLPLIWDAFSSPGCASLDPADLFAFSSNYFSYDNVDGASCAPRDGCPIGVQCLDTRCRISYMCVSPWRSCSYTWNQAAPTIYDQATCETQFRCSFVDPSISPTAASCASPADCDAVCGMAQPDFCGYCDPETLECFALPGVTSAAQCAAVTQACYQPALRTLTAGACTQGVCDILNGNDQGLTTSASDCATRSVCSLTYGTRPFQGPACLYGVEQAWPACNPGVTYAAGCKMVDAATNALLVDQASCVGPDPKYPLRNVSWIEPIATAAACEDDERLMVCMLNPLPLLYNRSLCEAVGGTFASPFSFRTGNFTPSQAVTVSWMPKAIVNRSVYLESGRLDFIKITQVFQDIVSQLRVFDLQSRATCRFASPVTTATEALSCLCYNDTDHICSSLTAVSSSGKPPPTITGITLVCFNQSKSILSPPALVELPTGFTYTPNRAPCIPMNVSYLSAGHFIANQTRVRGTSFFISRQDKQIPSLAVLNQYSSVVGRILSDGVYLNTHASEKFNHMRVCIDLRSDFVEDILAELSANSSKKSFPIFSFGRASSDYKQVNPISHPKISLRYFITPPDNTSLAETLPIVRYVCNDFYDVSIRPEDIYFAVILEEGYKDSYTAFSSTEINLLYATGAMFVFVATLIFCLGVPNIVHHLMHNSIRTLRISLVALMFMFCYYLLRGVLLFCLADAIIMDNSTAEFALSAFGVFCEYSAISLVGIYFLNLFRYLQKLRALPHMHRGTLGAFATLNLILLAVLIAFLIAFDTSSPDDGISSVLVSCKGRTTAGQAFWTTRRILRFAYSVIVAVFTLALGCFLIYISNLIRQQKSTQMATLNAFMLASFLASVSLVSQSIISLCLISTKYNNFAFCISMLWLVELVPLAMFSFLICWNYFENLRANLSKITGGTFGSSRTSTHVATSAKSATKSTVSPSNQSAPSAGDR